MTLQAKCQTHWNHLGIRNVEGLKEHIKAIFQRHDHQEHLLIDIYRMVLPDWDRINKIEGYPEAGSALWEFICNRFIRFDREHHPECLNGGAWLNTGFSTNSKLGPWEISFDNCQVIMD